MNTGIFLMKDFVAVWAGGPKPMIEIMITITRLTRESVKEYFHVTTVSHFVKEGQLTYLEGPQLHKSLMLLGWVLKTR